MLNEQQLKRFWAKVDNSSDCWEWTASRSHGGYGQFNIGGSAQRAHRVSWEIHFGHITGGLHCLHRCDNPGCVNPAHLFLGTQADNMADRDAKGRNRQQCGEKSGSSKLTTREVFQIREIWEFCNMTQKCIGGLFDVSRFTISNIVRSKTWRHLSCN